MVGVPRTFASHGHERAREKNNNLLLINCAKLEVIIKRLRMFTIDTRRRAARLINGGVKILKYLRRSLTGDLTDSLATHS